MEGDTIFGQIIRKEKPADIVFENDTLIAIKDIAPKAPVHLLIIPKKAYKNIQSVPKGDLPLMGEVVAVAQQLADEHGVADGYRLLTNNGPSAGQAVFHLHFHLIGGKSLGAMA